MGKKRWREEADAVRERKRGREGLDGGEGRRKGRGGTMHKHVPPHTNTCPGFGRSVPQH